MVNYIRSDLEFILEQIQVAEAHAAGGILYDPSNPDALIDQYNISVGLRTVDGSYNNLLPGQEYFGAADQVFPTLVDQTYRPGYSPGATLFDPSIRTISNLVVDQTPSNPAAIMDALGRLGVEGDLLTIALEIKSAFEDPIYNGRSLKQLFQAVDLAHDPVVRAAAEQALADARVVSFDALLETHGIELSAANVVLPAVATDEGLSAPFNSWFTFFGQFFDHGLDLVQKGGDGTIFIQLNPDDPLFDAGVDGIAGNGDDGPNFMMLTRATVAGADNVIGTADDGPVNLTSPFIDQNQTYTSHSSHQVFLRAYEMRGGRPADTGKLIEGADGGMATWAEVKAQAATMLGIQLTDYDVNKVPLLRTDAYGNFIRGADGFPLVILGIGDDNIPNTADDIVVEGDPTAPLDLSTVSVTVDGTTYTGAVRTAHAFLDDIAHAAAPFNPFGAPLAADSDSSTGLSEAGTYDNELLDRHLIAGDGRVNENIALTAVHHVFHAEHNRLADHTKDVLLADAKQMLLSGATQAEAVAFLNEWLDVEVGSITQATQVSQLTWDGDRIFQAAKFGTEMQYQHLVFEEFARKIHPTINAFVVPNGYDASIDPTIVGEFAHTVYRFGHSMLTESVDRFDSSFQDSSLGLIQAFLNPLEFNAGGTVDDAIAAGDIIRGMTRQTGNQIDEHVTSALRNNLLGLPLDLPSINIARGRDTGVPSLNDARARFYEDTDQDSRLKPYESWADFAANLKNEASIINFVAAYGTHVLITDQTTAEGKRNAALTLITGQSFGGLIVPSEEERLDFLNATGAFAGGNLGGLNNVDLWVGGLAEKTMPFGGMLGSTFSFVFEVQLEALQNGDRFYYLQRLTGLHLFAELEANSFASMIQENTNAAHLPSDVFSTPAWILEVDRLGRQWNDTNGDGVLDQLDPMGGSLLSPLVIRNDPATAGADTNYLRYTGGDHIVLGGTNNADTLVAGIGDDTLHGDGGDDKMQGGFGNDIINGGAGSDFIRDEGGDDNIKGGDGDDAIHSGPGLDLVLGESGNDFIVLGQDEASEAFGGEGNDFILGSRNSEPIIGNEGDDWLEDGMGETGVGDNLDDVRQRDGIRGNDVMIGGDGGFDEMVMEGGDDIMVGSLGAAKVAGMSGFDWSTYKDMPFGMTINLGLNFVADEVPLDDPTVQRFESVEGLSGTQFNDTLFGTDFTAADRLPGGGLTSGFQGSALDAQGIAMINGLQQLLGTGVTSYSDGDILLGGGGSDTISGGGGNDYIDGDKWLDVRIDVHQNLDGTGPIIESYHSMRDISARIFSGDLKPGQLTIGRYIMDGTATGTDVAMFSGNRSEYTIARNNNGTVTIAHVGGTTLDGTDILRNVEFAQFLDQQVFVANAVNQAPTGSPVLSDLTPTEGQALSVNTAGIADGNGVGAFSYQWESSQDGSNWTAIVGATAATFTPANPAGLVFGPMAGQMLRVVVRYTDGALFNESVTSAPTGPVGVNWTGNANNNVLNGTDGDDIGVGNGGADTMNGAAGNDNLSGSAGADVVSGEAGNDLLNGNDGNDTLTGGDGNDTINGNAGTDVAIYALAANNYSFGVNAANLVITANPGGTEGVDTVGTVETLRFAGLNYNVVLGTDAAAIHTGNATNQVIAARGGADTINGAGGDDIILAGAGNDLINQNAGNVGRDYVDGQGGTDTYTLTGTAASEIFQIRTRQDALDNGAVNLHVNTEIVVYRNGVIIAELDNVEEITVNTLATSANNGDGVVNGGTSVGDTIQVFGDFTQTSLNFSTFTFNGGRNLDTVDITGLTSDHRIVFRTNGGGDQVIGTLRPQDVIDSSSAHSPGKGRAPVLPERLADLLDAMDAAGKGHGAATLPGRVGELWDHLVDHPSVMAGKALDVPTLPGRFAGLWDQLSDIDHQAGRLWDRTAFARVQFELQLDDGGVFM